MKEQLSPQRVEEIFLDCLPRDEEDGVPLVQVDGIVTSAAFNLARLDVYRNSIARLLGELPDEFIRGLGGGMSFLNACMDRHGDQWTGEHRTMDQLFLLGMATGLVTCLMGRELWDVLPGGMPYYAVSGECRRVADVQS